MNGAFSDIVGQEQVVSLLSSAIDADAVSQAYLIARSDLATMRQIALCLAAAVLSPDCAEVRGDVLRQSHPDLHVLMPQGTNGYLIEQVREMIYDTGLTPVKASRKVYIVEQADQLRGAPANALLKTLEEPSDDVVCILLTENDQEVLATIRSRCQVLICHRGDGSTDRENQAVTDLLFRVAQGADNKAILDGAKLLLAANETDIDELKQQQDEESKAADQYLSQSATKSLEAGHKRRISMRQRELLLESIAVARSWLRDCLLVSQGTPELIAYQERYAEIVQVASSCGDRGLLDAVDATEKARMRISYNVTPQLAMEAMLFEIREALCPR